MSRVSVVILNWNGRGFLEQFLPSVVRYSEGAEIVVADNASTDDSVDFLRREYPMVRVVELPINYGFAKGYNEALKQVKADIYVLLNSDIEVSEGWLTEPVKLLLENEDVAACQPKILSYYERNKFEYAGAGGGYIDKYGYPFCRGRIFQEIELDNGQYDDVCEVFWASGASLFIKSDLFHKEGGFDEDFFAHMEEIDLCWRLKIDGYRVLYCGKSTVYHVGGGTLKKSSWRKTYLNMRNNLEMLYKNLPPKKLGRVMCYRILLDCIASIKFLVDGGFKDFYAVFRAHGHFYRHWRKIRAKRTNDSKAITYIYNGNIALEHHLKKVKLFEELNW